MCAQMVTPYQSSLTKGHYLVFVYIYIKGKVHKTVTKIFDYMDSFYDAYFSSL